MTASASLSTVVLDNGTGTIKAGFAGEDAPRLEDPTVAARARHPGVSGIILDSGTDNFIGHRAIEHRGLLQLNWPLKRGVVSDWLAMEEVWHEVFNVGLQISCEEHPLLMTECTDNTRAAREKATQVLFEVFNIPALVVSKQSTLALYATGRTSGIVVESGASRTHIGPVWEGYVMPHYQRRLDIGGADITEYLVQRLRAEGYPFSTDPDIDLACKLKEDFCYLASNAEAEKKYCSESKSVERLFNLPDGQQVYVNKLRFMCPELLFDPSPLGNPKLYGFHEAVHQTIQMCQSEIHAEMYGNVVLGGGNTLFSKLDERMQLEVSRMAPRGVVTKCVAFPERKYASWIGGSILGALSTFPCMWVSKAEYDDYGASIIHRKS